MAVLPWNCCKHQMMNLFTKLAQVKKKHKKTDISSMEFVEICTHFLYFNPSCLDDHIVDNPTFTGGINATWAIQSTPMILKQELEIIVSCMSQKFGLFVPTKVCSERPVT